MQVEKWEAVARCFLKTNSNLNPVYLGDWPQLGVGIKAEVTCPVCGDSQEIGTNVLTIIAEKDDIDFQCGHNVPILCGWLLETSITCLSCGVASVVPPNDRDKLSEEIRQCITVEWVEGQFAQNNVGIMSKEIEAYKRPGGLYYGGLYYDAWTSGSESSCLSKY